MLKKRLLSGGMACAMALSCLMTVPFATNAADTKYEFEDGEVGTGAVVDDSLTGYSGSGYVDAQEGNISVTVNVEEAGMYDLTVSYALPEDRGSKNQNLVINGTSQGEKAFSTTDGFVELNLGAVKLNAGKNTIAFEKSWGWVMFDYLTVAPAELTTLKGTNKLSDAKATASTQGLMNYLADMYGERILSGQQEYHGTSRDDEFEYIKDLTGSYPAIRGFDFGNKCNPLFGWDDGVTKRMISWANDEGGIVTASWHLNVPLDMKSWEPGQKVDWTETTYATESDFSVANLVNDPSSKEAKFFEESVELLAAELKKLQDADVPVIFRPLHEAEGNGGENQGWFWWATGGSENYKKLWKMLYTSLTEDYGIHNLIWAWNSYDYSTSANWYPGDEYVDMIGYDKYNATNWSTGTIAPNESAISSTFFNIVNRYNNSKVVAMTECDTVPDIDNMVDEKAMWLYFLPWYDQWLMDSSYNNASTLKEVYQSEYVVNLEDLPEYKTYELGDITPSTPAPTEPKDEPDVPPTTQAPEEGDNIDATLGKDADGNVTITLPQAVGDTMYLQVELPSSITYANGCVGTTVTVNGTPYWVSIKWETKKSGDVKMNMAKVFEVSLDGEAIEDEAIIDAAIEAVKKQKSFLGQVWWASDSAGESADASTVKITGAYTKGESTPGTTEPTEPSTPPVVVEGGFYVDGQTIRDANGNEFIMRGVNIAHCWYKDQTETSIKAAADLGTNCVRIVCSNGVQWDKTTATEIKNIIDWCKQNEQICILEVHDATGKDDASAIVAAAEYWTEMKDILNENKAYVILNIANEWYGQWNSSAWADGTKQAIGVIRKAGIENMIMIDSAGWGQYPTSIKEEGKSVFNADPNKNTVFSIHMYEYAGGNASMIQSNIEGAKESGAPIVIGEFGNKHTDGDVDEAFLMEYCEKNDIGYIGWSWKGNSGGVEYLDLVSDWEGTELTEWGEIFFNGANGVKGTSDLCTVYTSAPSTPTNPSQPSGNVNYGDVNCDNKVDVLDVIVLNKNLLGGGALTEQGIANADVDRDGSPTVADSLVILKYIISLVTELPVK